MSEQLSLLFEPNSNSQSEIIIGVFYRHNETGWLVETMQESQPFIIHQGNATDCKFLEGEKVGRTFSIPNSELIFKTDSDNN
jgi:hypothetical protein